MNMEERLQAVVSQSEVFHQYGNYGHWEEYNSFSFLVSPGDVVKLTGGELSFLPCKGA